MSLQELLPAQQSKRDRLKWVGKYATLMPQELTDEAQKDLYFNSVFLTKEKLLNLTTTINLCYRYPYLISDRPIKQYQTTSLLNYLAENKNIDEKDYNKACKIIEVNEKNRQEIDYLLYTLENFALFDKHNPNSQEYNDLITFTKEGFDFLIQKCHLFIPYSTFEKLIIKYPEIAQIEPNLIKNYRNISKLNPYFDDSHFCKTILERQPQLNTILEKEK